MQKKLIALAVAGLGLSGAAFAQTNVTIYGIFDATFDSVTATGAAGGGANRPRFSRIESNSSYIGFKGTEDMGDGMSAIFQFETGFNTDTGFYSGSGRDTFVGLKGSGGTLKMGNLTGPTRAIGVAMEVWPGRTGMGTFDSLLGKPLMGAGDGLFDTRTANTLSYTTPTFGGGFGATLNYAPSENQTNDKAPPGTKLNGKLWELGLNYVNGPWYAAYAYGKFDAGSNAFAAGTMQTWKSNRLGLGYMFEGGHKINFIWDKQEEDFSTSKDTERTGWALEGLFKLTPSGSLLGSYTRVGDASGSYLPTTALKTNTNTEAKMWTVGYLYSLSKRTSVKALWTKISNGSNASYDFGTNGVTTAGTGGTAAAVGPGASPQGVSLGLRHSF